MNMDLSLPERLSGDDDETRFLPRRSHRVPMTEATVLRSGGAGSHNVTVCDLSTSGFMAECMRPVLIGSYVSLDLPGIGPVHAQIRWQVGGKLGGKFLDPISLYRCSWTTTRFAG